MANRCCPYGCLTTLPILVCFVATLLTGIATFDCRFFEISAYDEMYDKRSIGLWTAETHNVDLYYDDDYTCVGWNEHSELSTDLFDASMRFGRAMSLLASLLSLIVLVSVFILTCVPVGKEGLKILACCHFLVALPTILMLVAFHSNICNDAETCDMRVDSILCIVAFLLWLLAGATILCLKEDEDMQPPPYQVPARVGSNTESGITKTTTVYRTPNPDGSTTKVTTTTVTNIDGSKTVTETKEIEGSPIPTATVVAIPIEDTNVIYEPEENPIYSPKK